MAFYTIETNHLDPSYNLDPAIVALASEELPFHSFETELRVISEHAELVKEQKEAEEEVAAAAAAAKVKEEEAKALELARKEEEKAARLKAEAEEAAKAAQAAPAMETKTSANGDGVPVANAISNDGGDVAATIAQPDTGNPTMIGKAAELNNDNNESRTSLSREVSIGEQDALAAVAAALEKNNTSDAVDPEIQRILDHDEMVTKMCERTKLSRSDCFFYLESADYDLESAVALFESLVIN